VGVKTNFAFFSPLLSFVSNRDTCLSVFSSDEYCAVPQQQMGELQGAHDTLQKEMEDLLIYLAEQDANRKELKVCPSPHPSPGASPTPLIALKGGGVQACC
jgi:hypothetical protein